MILIDSNPALNDIKELLQKNLKEIFPWNDSTKYSVSVNYKKDNTDELYVEIIAPYTALTLITELNDRNNTILNTFREIGIKGTMIITSSFSKVILDLPNNIHAIEHIFILLKIKGI